MKKTKERITIQHQDEENYVTDYDVAYAMAHAYELNEDGRPGATVNDLRSSATVNRKSTSDELQDRARSDEARAVALEASVELPWRRDKQAALGQMIASLEDVANGAAPWPLEADRNTNDHDSELERKASEVIAILERQFEGATFKLIGDTVMCTDPNGIDFGKHDKDFDPARSWDAIMADTEANKKRFVVEIDGKLVDTRGGMTYEAYKAFVQAQKDAGAELPDSKANRLDNGWYTWTLMTGEAGGVDAPVAWVDDGGSVRQAWTRRGLDLRALRVRPAVNIAELLR